MTVIILALFFSLFLAAAFLVRWARIAQSLPWITARSSYPPLTHPPPKASVIVPARNEEDNIELCLTSLLSQDYPNLEIIVVNDRSEDKTSEILARIDGEYARRRGEAGAATTEPFPDLVLVDGKPCPPEWVGKNHALYQGYRVARGDFLLFLDADTRAHPSLVSRTVGYATHSSTGLLTLIHSCEFQCFWDSVVNSLILYLALFQKVERFNDPEDRAANAHGPFLLFKREAYEAIGGHEAIKSEVVEDLVLAEKIKEKKKGLTWAITPDLLVSRPYPSLADLRRGWGKVLFRAIERNRKLLYANLLSPFFLAFYLLPAWAVTVTLGIRGLGHGLDPVLFATLALGLSQIITVTATLRVLAILFRLRPMYPPAYPLGVFILGWLQLEAVARYLTGKKVTWKGRHYREKG